MKKKVSSLLFGMLCILIATNAQKKLKSVYPFRKTFVNRDSLQIQEFKNHIRYPIQKEEIDSISNLRFLKANVDVESLGVTPYSFISIYSNNERIVLISIWYYSESLYAINISINDKFMYHGLIIQKSKLKQLTAAIIAKSTSE